MLTAKEKRPLQARTNIVNNQTASTPSLQDLKNHVSQGPLKPVSTNRTGVLPPKGSSKKSQKKVDKSTPKQAAKVIADQSKTAIEKLPEKVDENTEALLHLLDDELYERVMKLELADDGFPPIKSYEPFDF